MNVQPAPVKVLIADDHALFRAGLALMLSSDSRFEVVGEAKNGVEAVEQTLARKPDIVLMDLQMPELNGVDAVKKLRLEAPEVRVLVVSAYADQAVIGEALAGGATGYMHKDVAFEDVASHILGVHVDKRSKSRARRGQLSNRELHVLKQVAAGLPNKQIAKRLGISEKTVRNHLSRVFNKLGASNRTEAVMNAMRVGMLIV